MDLREFLAWVEREDRLTVIGSAVNPDLEMARIIHALEGQSVLFADPRCPGWRVVSGVCARREYFAWALGTDVIGIVPRLVEALNHPLEPPLISAAPCQEIVDPSLSLTDLPLLKHLNRDGGPYITAGVSV
ncbi:MAG TPA: UbiD family decarboxylase domain-containing protein, partial [Anaerolineae bacterium]|nr:UbiD family decarboxylase domain-containing protein [Anaerolineae bacterium]